MPDPAPSSDPASPQPSDAGLPATSTSPAPTRPSAPAGSGSLFCVLFPDRCTLSGRGSTRGSSGMLYTIDLPPAVVPALLADLDIPEPSITTNRPKVPNSEPTSASTWPPASVSQAPLSLSSEPPSPSTSPSASPSPQPAANINLPEPSNSGSPLPSPSAPRSTAASKSTTASVAAPTTAPVTVQDGPRNALLIIGLTVGLLLAFVCISVIVVAWRVRKRRLKVLREQRLLVSYEDSFTSSRSGSDSIPSLPSYMLSSSTDPTRPTPSPPKPAASPPKPPHWILPPAEASSS
ncbi:hypothetical protein HK105_209377 [Polyrhizophydium stewartii]|uniref:Uncharacterized protein n=1 Tax=Polyrhizophydium stewartii TaxID=2732419 RepID=A0ABR4MV93_9FUNG